MKICYFPDFQKKLSKTKNYQSHDLFEFPPNYVIVSVKNRYFTRVEKFSKRTEKIYTITSLDCLI